MLKLFVDRELFEPEVAESMLGWMHAGFSVDDSVWLDQDDTPSHLRLARYCARKGVSLEYHADGGEVGEVIYTSDKAAGPTAGSHTFESSFSARRPSRSLVTTALPVATLCWRAPRCGDTLFTADWNSYHYLVCRRAAAVSAAAQLTGVLRLWREVTLGSHLRAPADLVRELPGDMVTPDHPAFSERREPARGRRQGRSVLVSLGAGEHGGPIARPVGGAR